MKRLTRTLPGPVAATAHAAAALAKPLASPVDRPDMPGEGEVVAIDAREKPEEGPDCLGEEPCLRLA